MKLFGLIQFSVCIPAAAMVSLKIGCTDWYLVQWAPCQDVAVAGRQGWLSCVWLGLATPAAVTVLLIFPACWSGSIQAGGANETARLAEWVYNPDWDMESQMDQHLWLFKFFFFIIFNSGLFMNIDMEIMTYFICTCTGSNVYRKCCPLSVYHTCQSASIKFYVGSIPEVSERLQQWYRSPSC